MSSRRTRTGVHLGCRYRYAPRNSVLAVESREYCWFLWGPDGEFRGDFPSKSEMIGHADDLVACQENRLKTARDALKLLSLKPYWDVEEWYKGLRKENPCFRDLEFQEFMDLGFREGARQ